MPDPVVSRERKNRRSAPYAIRFVTRPTPPIVNAREIVVWRDSSSGGEIHFLLKTEDNELYRFDGTLVT
jgi:hypothetical protein